MLFASQFRLIWALLQLDLLHLLLQLVLDFVKGSFQVQELQHRIEFLVLQIDLVVRISNPAKLENYLNHWQLSGTSCLANLLWMYNPLNRSKLSLTELSFCKQLNFSASVLLFIVYHLSFCWSLRTQRKNYIKGFNEHTNRISVSKPFVFIDVD